MAKDLKFDDAARQALEAGINTMANCVRVTLGPRGRNVVIEKKFGVPTITNDGVTIAKAIEKQAKDVDDRAEIAHVASISAADRSIGDTIADAIDKVGKDGVVTVE